jgi:transcriptional regulator with XRE-family HTH domain
MSRKPGPKKGMKRNERTRSEFAKNLIAIRQKKGISQVELGKRMGLSQRVISFYEGRSEGPSPELLTRFALALGVDPKELIGMKKSVPPEDLPSRALQKRWSVLAKLPEEDQKYIAKTIDMLAERRGMN